MPIYTYRCDSCGVQFERTQKFSDQPLTRCPECGKKELHKVYTPVGIVFKGSGFYSTDNRSSSGGGRGKHVDSKSASEASAKSETKSSESSATSSSDNASAKSSSDTSSTTSSKSE